jgi:phenylalanyl-tRNA synthetase beta chain
MKVSMRWLSQYVDLTGYTGEQLAERLTRSGIEVDAVEKRNKGVSGVVAGEVKTREKHPDADKLSVCTVDVGGGELLQIVCGAPNVAAGQKVPVALVGATLPGGVKIKRAKLRGVESQGMICSAKELGMNDKLLPKELQEGILVLPENVEIGKDVVELLELDDEVLELDLTPNRSDCLSMIGVAYEVAAILGRPVTVPSANVREGEGKRAQDAFSVTIEAPEGCSMYTARLIEGVKIGPSPLWMQNRLMAAGIRPINNVVDVTNYVMLEYGQPLHAFDADRLAGGQIRVRYAGAGETITTLDDEERRLEPHMLVIADAEKAVALAGVMGGANSEVTASTARILLESAKFDGGTVRKTSRELGLRSESSLRFEKEVNPHAVVEALNRAAALIVETAGGAAAAGVVKAETRSFSEPVIGLSADRVNRYLGTQLSVDEMKSIFDRLRFSYAVKGDALEVTVPLRRGDISRDVDLIEEIARLYGYDNIPATPISGVTTPGGRTRSQRIRLEVGRYLNAAGLHEVILYSFTHPDRIAEFPGLYPHIKPVALSMPMSVERSVLRTSLIPHLIDTAVYNRNRNVDDVAVFEIGSVFLTEEERLTKQPEEKMLVSALWTGKREEKHWSGKPVPVDFYDLKGVLDGLFRHLDVRGVTYRVAAFDKLHPGRAAEIFAGDRRIGVIGQLHPELQRRYDLEDTYVFEIELDALVSNANFAITYETLPKYPSIARDIAVVVDKSVPVANLIAAVREAGGDWLRSVEVFDVYAGEKIGAGKKSVALSLVYRADDRTLTDDEVNERNQSVIERLERTYSAELRK